MFKASNALSLSAALLAGCVGEPPSSAASSAADLRRPLRIATWNLEHLAVADGKGAALAWRQTTRSSGGTQKGSAPTL